LDLLFYYGYVEWLVFLIHVDVLRDHVTIWFSESKLVIHISNWIKLNLINLKNIVDTGIRNLMSGK